MTRRILHTLNEAVEYQSNACKKKERSVDIIFNHKEGVCGKVRDDFFSATICIPCNTFVAV